MRVVIWVVAVLAAIYAGYWVVGSRAVERGAVAALADLEARGWGVDYADLSTRGFPSRFDTTVTDVALTTPDGQVTWAAPFLQVFALSYRPNEVIAAFPPTQMVTVGARAFEVGSERLLASASAGFSTDLPLRAAAVESGPLTVAGEGVEVTLGRLLFAARRAEDEGGDTPAYLVFLEGEDVAVLGTPALDLLRVDAVATLDRVVDRRLREAPRLVSLTLREARLARGTAALTATGTLMPDAEGFLAGEVVLVAEDWRAILDQGVEAGALPAEQAALFAGALEGLAEGDRITVPVTFAEGRISALGLPLLDAPFVGDPQRQ